MIAEARHSSRKTSSLGVRLLTGALALLALSPARAVAQSAADSATAQALFDRAKKLVADGKYSEACPAFEESERIESRSGTLLNLADCYEKEGRLASAWSTFLEAATLAKTTGNAEREQGARARAAALVPQLSNLVINAPSASIPGLEITRDGVRVGAAQLGLPLPADAGTHTVTVRAPGKKPWDTTVTVQGSANTASVTVPDLESDASTSATPATAPAAPGQLAQSPQPTESSPSSGATPRASEADRGAHGRSNAGVIVAGVVTGVFAAGSVVTSVLYSGKLHDYNAANDQHAANAADLRSQTKTLGVANLALLGGTVVAGAVTIYLWSRPASAGASKSARLELRGEVSPSLAGLSLGGSL